MTPTGAWDWAFAWSILPQLLWATVYSVFAAVSSFAGALVIGLPLAIARDANSRTVRRRFRRLVEFVRSTPILLQVYFLYFVLPHDRHRLACAPGRRARAVASLRNLRLGSLPCRHRQRRRRPAQRRRRARPLAARRVHLDVVLPQAITPIIPALGNHLIALFKETPLLSAIAIVELLQTAKIIGSETFRYNEPITMVGLILLALSLLSAGLVRRVERWATRWR